MHNFAKKMNAALIKAGFEIDTSEPIVPNQTTQEDHAFTRFKKDGKFYSISVTKGFSMLGSPGLAVEIVKQQMANDLMPEKHINGIDHPLWLTISDAQIPR